MTDPAADNHRNPGLVPVQPHALAVVVFTNSVDMTWLRVLAQGFRHCFVFVEVGSDWIMIDPLSNQMTIRSLEVISSHDLASWYTEQGHTAIVTYQRYPMNRVAPLGLFTCVEVIKRALGIHSVWVQTPFQLFKYLKKENNP